MERVRKTINHAIVAAVVVKYRNDKPNIQINNMQEETVLFHDDLANITVTDSRLIYGSNTIDIGQIKHAGCFNVDGIRSYFIAIILVIFGILLTLTFSWWSFLGLVLLIHPAFVFLDKKKYHIFISLKSGGTIESDIFTNRKYTKTVAKEITEATQNAVQKYDIANDPRRNLNL